jgi:hypothetical protein
MRLPRLEPTYVTYVPGELEQGRLYISMEYSTRAAIACGGRRLERYGGVDHWLLPARRGSLPRRSRR